MGRGFKYIYSVYDGDKLIAEGTDFQMQQKFNVGTRMREYVFSNRKIDERYVVKRERANKYIEKKELEELAKIPKKETLYEETKRLINTYGNTNFRKDPKDLVEQLKQDGIVCDIKQFNKNSWVIERVN